MIGVRSLTLHRAPRWGNVFVEQVRATGLIIRRVGVLVLVLFALLATSCIRAAYAVRETNRLHVGGGAVNFAYTPHVSVLLVAFALLLPVFIWQDEDPRLRLYHWSMPVPRSTHAFAKSLAGFAWLVLVAIVFLIGLVAVKAITERITDMPQPYDRSFVWWEWLVPFTALGIAYILASAAAVGARRPIIWIFGSIALYVLTTMLLKSLGYADAARAMQAFVTGYYGVAAAVGGYIDANRPSASLTASSFQSTQANFAPSVHRWLVTAGLWGSASIAIFFAVAKRRPSE